MLFSVIIPTFNRLELLKETLASLPLRRTDLMEVIVIDDGSTDGTREYLAGRDDVAWFAQENQGPSAARNLGAAHAEGRYLAFLDSDDLWFPWTLETYEKAVTETEGSFFAGRPFRFNDRKDLESVEPGSLSVDRFRDYLESGDVWRWWGCSSFVVSKSAFSKVGGFTASRINAEDADLAMRLGEEAGFVQIKAPHTFAYREHEVSEMKNHTLNFKGIEHLLDMQRRGEYPGSQDRRYEQWRIISRHLRPASLAACSQNEKSLAWRIYRATFRHHLRTGRWKYLLGFPVHALKP